MCVQPCFLCFISCVLGYTLSPLEDSAGQISTMLGLLFGALWLGGSCLSLWRGLVNLRDIVPFQLVVVPPNNTHSNDVLMGN